MADNSIILELNITAANTKKSIDSVGAALKKLRGESESAVAKLRGLTQAFRITDTSAAKLSADLDGLADRLSNIAGISREAARGMRSFNSAMNNKQTKQPQPEAQNPIMPVAPQMTDITPASPVMHEYTQAAGEASKANYDFADSNKVLTGTLYEYTEATEEADGITMEYTDYTKQAVGGNEDIKDALAETKKAMGETAQETKKATAAIKSHTSAFSKLFASVKRVAFYRAIRTALKEVTDGFREGTTNLYYYSQALNNVDSAKAVGTMNGFATTALYVKNSLGAALMPVLQSLLPIVKAIADAFVTAANAVNQFFHALKGESKFTKAKRYAVDYAEALDGASGSAKELKKQIFGFDELNIFNSPSGGGGGSASGLDYSQMFDEAELTGFFKRLKETVQKNLGDNFLARFKLKWTEVQSDFSSLDGEGVASKILTQFYKLFGGVTGFILGGPVGAVVGSIAGAALGVGFSTIDLDGDGEMKEDEIKVMLREACATLTGAVIGWTLGGTTGMALGASIATGLTALVKVFGIEPNTTLDALTTMGYIGGVVAFIIKAATGLAVGKPSPTSLPLLAAAGLTLNIASLIYSPNFKDTKQRIGAAIAEAINVIAAGAIIGAMFGGPGGALIGIAIGVGLNLLINSIDWSGFDAVSKRAQEYIDGKIDLKAVEAYKQGKLDEYRTYGNSNKEKRKLLQARGEADGGLVPSGTYFYAGESGPELVGQVGSKTNVTNQDQFTAGMWDVMDATNTVILQAAQALISAVQNKDFTSVVQIGDRDIVSAYDRGKTLAGTALVE